MADDDEESAQSTLFVRGLHLAFRNLTVSVPTADPPTLLLRAVSGAVRPGQLVFLMGPSGAGKSTLLDTLADRMSLPVDGDLLVDGRSRDRREWAKRTKYVPQDDSLYASLTVKEAVTYAARLYNVSDRSRRVRDTLDALGLTDAADTKTGGLFFRGLSGGQKRRLSVAIELVARPDLVLLDEPTSGLDSASAYALMDMLRSLAHEKGASVIVSIHQPSKKIFDFADQVAFLARGRVAYFGPPARVVDHFEAASGSRLPPQTDVSAWIIDLLSDRDTDKVDAIADFWETGGADVKSEMDERVAAAFSKDWQGGDDEKGVVGRDLPWGGQTAVLLSRTMKNFLRDPGVFWLRIMMYAILGLFFGAVWFNIGSNTLDVEDQAASFFFIVAFFSFMTVAAAPIYLEEKRQIVREKASGAYRLSALFVAHTVAEIPFIFLNALISGTLAYWMQGLRSSAGAYLYFIVTLFLILQWAESLTYFAITVNRFEILALGLNSLFNGLFMALGGYLRPPGEIPWWWRWMDYSINAQYFSFNAVMKNEFAERQLDDASDSFPPRPAMSGNEYLDSLGLIVSTNIYWISVLAVLGGSLVLRLASLLWAERTWTGKR